MRKYLDKGNAKEVNYLDFCKDVDRPEDMFPEYVAKRPLPPSIVDPPKKVVSTFYAAPTGGVNVLESRFSQQPVNIANNPADVMERLQAAILMKRVRIEEFFRDYDKLRKGTVTYSQFKGILSVLNFSLTDDESDYIIDTFKTPPPYSQFNYYKFCEIINTAFT